MKKFIVFANTMKKIIVFDKHYEKIHSVFKHYEFCQINFPNTPKKFSVYNKRRNTKYNKN